MKRSFRKSFLATLFALCLVLVMAAGVSAAKVSGGSCGDNVTWLLDDQGVLTISGIGNMQDFYDSDPDYFEPPAPWSDFREKINSVVIKPGVTSVGAYAFYDCRLTSVTIPDSVVSIGGHAFSQCQILETMTIPQGVKTIGEHAFSGCERLKTITVPKSVESIENGAFYFCIGLKSVTISEGVKTIGAYAFSACYELTSVMIPGSVTSIGDYAFLHCHDLESVTIPEGVKYIGIGAFYGENKIASVTIPKSVTSIGARAFSGEAMTSIKVESENPAYCVKDGVLFDKTGATLVSYPSGRINDSLTYEVPAGVKTIGAYAFENCYYKLHSVKIPEGVTSIGEGAFYWCCLNTLYIPKSLENIDTQAFEYPLGIINQIYYNGSVLDWSGITIEASNNRLLESPILYNYKEVTGVTLNKTALTLALGKSETLKAIVAPTNASVKTVQWNSSDWSIAEVDSNGKVTANGVGTAAITATTDDGNKVAVCKVEVVIPVTSISLGMEELTLNVGGSATLSAAVEPFNATNKEVTWKSDNTGVATVTDGKVSAVKAGTANITATSADGSKISSCKVTVIVPVFGVTLNQTALTLVLGKSETLKATVAPTNASIKTVRWNSSDWGVAEIDEKGKITAVGAGTAVITATTENGNKVAVCNVIVVLPVTGVTLDKTSITLAEGSFKTLTATVLPENAGNKAVTWKSINNEVASVDSNGNVSALNEGNATITVTTEDGKKTASCTVNVIDKGIDRGKCGDDLEWVLSDDGTLTVFGTGNMWDRNKLSDWNYNKYIIKKIVIEAGATSIGNSAFDDFLSLTGVSIPSTVVSVNSRAFSGCPALTEVTLPDSVAEIGNEAFSDCTALTSVALPQNVTSIENGVFHGCSALKSISIPSGVRSVGENAFKDCVGMTELVIPETVSSIGISAFEGCSSLPAVNIPDSVNYIGNNAFMNCSALKDLSLSQNVKFIGHSAFEGCSSLPSVTIPGSVTTIGTYVFKDCTSLSEVVLPESIKYIGKCVFYHCTALNDITIPDSVVEIGNGTFYGCESLEQVTIPEGAEKVGEGTFAGYDALTSAEILNSDETIENSSTAASTSSVEYDRAAGNALPYSVLLSSGVIPLSDSMTSELNDNRITGLKAINVSKNNPAYTSRDGVFFDKAGTSLLQYPSGRSGKYRIPTDVKKIEKYAFSGCNGLTEIVIPLSVASIDELAFCGCGKLKTVYYAGTKEEWSKIKIGEKNDSLLNAKIIYSAKETSFTDVTDEGKFYFTPVYWAVDHDPQITNGLDTTHFGPDQTCTRGQVVTFLWRAKGCPEPASAKNSFKDVKTTDYFYKAVLWAVENGITNGTSGTTFSPKNPCTRAQVAAFLYRTEGSPAADAKNPFTDVKNGAYYYDAVLWAVEQGITNGTSSATFSPDKTCTRGEIVTFLYRDLAS